MARLDYEDVKKLVVAHNKSGFSIELLLCLIWKESSFDPAATNPASTATGLTMMTTAAVNDVNANTPQGVHFSHSEMTNAARNVECGTYYLALLVKRHGSETKALEHFGTGAGYPGPLRKCEVCLRAAPVDPQACLNALHP